MPRPGLRLVELNLPPDVVDIIRHGGTPGLCGSDFTRVRQVADELKRQHDAIRLEKSKLILPAQWFIKEDLRREGERVKQQIHACKSVKAPVRRLPLELLGEVFLYCLSPNSLEDEGDETRMRSPLFLTGICFQWRAAAFATPYIWTSVKIEVLEPMAPDTDSMVLMEDAKEITKWMDRARFVPWNLSVELHKHSHHYQYGGRRTVTHRSLLQHPASARLVTLIIEANFAGQEFHELTFPAVKSVLYIWNAERRSENSPDEPRPIVPFTPRLKRAVLVSMFWLNFYPANIPWAHLTHLYVDNSFTPGQWRSIIKKCTSLQQGCFRSRWSNEDEEDKNVFEYSAAPVTLPDLTELVMLELLPFDIPLEGLRCPALTKLKLFYHWLEIPIWSPSALDLLFTVTDLTLAGRGEVVMDTEIVPILNSAPNLTKLTIHINVECDQLFQYLTFDRSRPRLPHLGTLDLHCDMWRYRHEDAGDMEQDRHGDTEMTEPDPLLFPLGMLVDLIASRRHVGRGPAQLQQVVLRVSEEGWSDTIKEIKEKLEPFKRGGLEVMLKADEVVHGDAPRSSRGFMLWEDGMLDFVDEDPTYRQE